MKVLHINQSDISGGAAISGYRLHQGLLAQGIDSKLLVGNVKTDDPHVAAVLRKPRIENQLNRISYRLGLNYINLLKYMYRIIYTLRQGWLIVPAIYLCN